MGSVVRLLEASIPDVYVLSLRIGKFGQVDTLYHTTKTVKITFPRPISYYKYMYQILSLCPYF